MRAAGLDYFENSRRATFANLAYCTANPQRWDGWSKDVWGLTACDGPGNYSLAFKSETRQFFGYSARGPLGQPDAAEGPVDLEAHQRHHSLAVLPGLLQQVLADRTAPSELRQVAQQARGHERVQLAKRAGIAVLH